MEALGAELIYDGELLLKATEAIPETGQLVFCNAKNLLREHFTEKQAFSEYAVSAGPFVWLSELQNWSGRWSDLPSKDQDFMLEDVKMFHAGDLDAALRRWMNCSKATKGQWPPS